MFHYIKHICFLVAVFLNGNIVFVSCFDDDLITCPSSGPVPSEGISECNTVPRPLASTCYAVDFGRGSVVCMCNASYCDEFEPIEKPPADSFWVYTTSKDGLRFDKSLQRVTLERPPEAKLFTIDRNSTLQEIIGFGGAFTDAFGINVNSLSADTKQNLLRAYFSEAGIEYNLCRVPIGGSDFSARGYTYNDGHDGDFDLDHFQLAHEDLNDKIPVILEAQRLSPHALKLFASPWSPPIWMKTNDALNGKGQLKGEPGGQYYKTWANYFVRFLNEYANRSVNFWGLTSQNEPIFASFGNFMDAINNVDMSASKLHDFIVQDLGPALNASGYGDLKLMTYDEVLMFVPFYLHTLLPKGSKIHDYVSGIGFHWYTNNMLEPGLVSKMHQDYPEMFLLSTEACEGVTDEDVILGSWDRAESYAVDIIKDLLHWTSGWVDWNMALDMQGGPNWVHNFVDSPIIVNASQDVFYKQPMFYALGHFSKFIPPESKLLSLNAECGDPDLMALASVTPLNYTTVVILNRGDHATPVAIQDVDKFLSVTMPPKSIQTFLW